AQLGVRAWSAWVPTPPTSPALPCPAGAATAAPGATPPPACARRAGPALTSSAVMEFLPLAALALVPAVGLEAGLTPPPARALTERLMDWPDYSTATSRSAEICRKAAAPSK